MEDLLYWKDKAILLQNMVVDISNIIENVSNNEVIEDIKNIYKKNKWEI